MKAEERAKTLLQKAGMLVYEPGQQAGICKAPYVVAHCFGNYPTIQSRNLRYTLLKLHCYVPLDGNQTAALGILADRVKAAMRDMHGQAKPTGQEGVDMVESDFKALSRTIEYQVLKAQKG